MSPVPGMFVLLLLSPFFLENGKRKADVSCNTSEQRRQTVNEIINISDSQLCVCVWVLVSHPVLWNPDNTLLLSDGQSRRAKWSLEPSPSACFPHSCPPSQTTRQVEFPLRMPEPIPFPTPGALWLAERLGEFPVSRFGPGESVYPVTPGMRLVARVCSRSGLPVASPPRFVLRILVVVISGGGDVN